MPRQFKHIDLTEFEVKFADSGVATIEGYASTFGNVDSQKDVVVPGAFKASVARHLPRMLYQHQTDRIPGIWEAATEDSKGLVVRGRTLDTTLGRDAAEEVRSGAIKTMSIGYGTRKARFDKAAGVRYLEQLDLWEVSLVTFPANDQATITRVKSLNADVGGAAALIAEAAALCRAESKSGDLLDLLTRAEALLVDAGEKAFTPDDIAGILRDAGVPLDQVKGLLTVVPDRIDPQPGDHGLDRLFTLLNNTN